MEFLHSRNIPKIYKTENTIKHEKQEEEVEKYIQMSDLK